MTRLLAARLVSRARAAFQRLSSSVLAGWSMEPDLSYEVQCPSVLDHGSVDRALLLWVGAESRGWCQGRTNDGALTASRWGHPSLLRRRRRRVRVPVYGL